MDEERHANEQQMNFNIGVYSELINILRKRKVNQLTIDNQYKVPYIRSQQVGMNFRRALQIARDRKWDGVKDIVSWRAAASQRQPQAVVQNNDNQLENERPRYIAYIKQIDDINMEKPLTEERRRNIKKSLYYKYPLNRREEATAEDAERERDAELERVVPLTEFGLRSFGLRGRQHEYNFYRILDFVEENDDDDDPYTVEEQIHDFVIDATTGGHYNKVIIDRQGNPIRLIAMDYLRLHSEPENSSDYYNPYKSVMTGRARKTKKLKDKEKKGKKMLKTKKKMRKNKKKMKLTKTRKNKSRKNIKKTLKAR
jgi:hypothetical protein